MRKTYKFKAKISKTTAEHANHWLWKCQQLYNTALEQRITAYKRCGITLSPVDQKNELKEFKEAFPEFKQVGSQVLQDVIERLGKAFDGFFRRLKKSEKAGFPRFRSASRYDSFTLKQAGWSLDGRYLKVKNVGIFKLYLSRPIEGKIKTITIRRDAYGDWWVCFSCDQVPEKASKPTEEEVGADVGLESFLTDSNGNKIENPRYYRKLQKKLRRKQRKVSRRKKGSKRRGKAVKVLAKTHRQVVNMRLDFLHKVANQYIEKYKVIVLENLTVKNMVKNRHLSKSISDASWSTFVNLLLYKAEEAGRTVILVDPKGTSQECSGCGEIVHKTLAVRIHDCPHCGLQIDRDVNAARNILKRGIGQILKALTQSIRANVALESIPL